MHPPQHTRSVDLSREEQWVLHHVVLDRLEFYASDAEASRPPNELVRAFEKLDSGRFAFSRQERRHLRDLLHRYTEARDTPERDRPVARSLLSRLHAVRPAPAGGSAVDPDDEDASTADTC